MILGTLLTTFLWGELVGRDAHGNRYYRDRKHPRGRRERRWVVYAGAPEASKVPPEWHGWLHHANAAPPVEGKTDRKPWQQEHQPNMTGTSDAYRPPGHILRGGRRDRATGDYEPWRPG